MNEPRCNNCRFWRKHHCHFGPPMATDGLKAVFPYTEFDDWCGKYEPARAKEGAA